MIEDNIFIGEFARQREVEALSLLEIEIKTVVEYITSITDTFTVIVDSPIADRSKSIAGDTHHQFLDLFQVSKQE